MNNKEIEQVSKKVIIVHKTGNKAYIRLFPASYCFFCLILKSSVIIENLNNNARTSHSDLSNTLILDDTTHLSATLAQSTSSRISHSRYLKTFKEDNKKVSSSSIRWFVRQAINSCRENLTLVDQLLENIPSYDHILPRTNCTLNTPNTIKGLQYYPSTSVQTE